MNEWMEQTQRMEQTQNAAAAETHHHPARIPILNLFNLYLGLNHSNDCQKRDRSIREPPNKAQKRVLALNRELPPPNEQFLPDFMQLKNQFPDQDQLCSVTESILVLQIMQCSSHVIRAEFLIYAIQNLCSVDYINWDTFLPSLLSSVSSKEFPVGPENQSMQTVSSNFQSSNHASQLSSVRHDDIHSIRQLCCKIILMGLEFGLKPLVCGEIFNHMVNWLVNWDQREQGVDESDMLKSCRPHKHTTAWLHSCLDVIRLLVDEGKCRVPFYELLRSDLQFIDNFPNDEALFTLILEIHRRRDMMAMNMQMLDQHLHCPTFGTCHILTQTTPNVSVEALAQMRLTPITYLSVLGEPLHGEDISASIQKGSLDWERALRCIRHALCTTPSPEWWRRVLLPAPCYRPSSQGSSPGAVFSSAMMCEATIDRILELLALTNSEIDCWQDWLVFSDIFFFLIKNGCIDFVEFVDNLASRLTQGDQHVLKTNHVTWLFAQIMRVELVINALNSDARKVETTKKLLSFHREERNSDSNSPRSILLAFISSCQSLCIWSLNSSTREYMNYEQRQKGKLMDEWWKQASKGDRIMDYMNMDEHSIGMFWVLSYTMTQPACETVLKWLTSAGVIDLLQGTNLQPTERLMATQEVSPLPMSLLSGMSMSLFMKLSLQLEEALFSGQVVPSIAMVETYTRLLLLSPHSLFRSHFTHLAQRYPSSLSKPGVRLLVLEILNYRLLPLYRYEGKNKSLMYDVTKIISALKAKRGDHRVFRLAENLCLNLIFSLRDFFLVKREGKGPSEFTETLNRATVITLAILIKTHGIANADHLLYLRPMLEQILANSTHTWSEKTLRYFPTVLREALSGLLIDKRSLAIQAWQQAEAVVLRQCTQILSSSADNYVTTYIGHSFPQHRQYLCAGAWILMHGHAETINSGNLGRVLVEFSPEEVTSNIYTMVDVLLYHMQMELQRGHALQDLLLKACTSLGFFVWTNELLPLDILLLALIDRDDDPNALRIVISLLDRPELQQRVNLFCMSCGHHEHWLYSGIFKRVDPQKALGNYLSWKDRYPVFFDDIAARLLPVIPLIIYRLIENDAMEAADRLLAMNSSFLTFYPLRFTFVRDILSYFYGHLPVKLIIRILQVLDVNKIPFSDSFWQHISSNPATCPPLDYFSTSLLRIVNNVIPPLHNKSKSCSMGDTSNNAPHTLPNKAPPASQSGQANTSDDRKAFYQIQDPGTYTQLVLETAVIEILSLPVSASRIVQSFVQIIVNIQSMLIQSNSSLHAQGSDFATSPSGGSSDSLGASRSTNTFSGIYTANFSHLQQLSCLLIQACGLLLSQLPPDFHFQLYLETTRIIKENWSLGEIGSAVGYALIDPTFAAEDNTSTPIGNVVGLLHSFFSNLSQEWLEGTHVIIKQLQPVTSVAMLRIAFRIIGPLLPKLANVHTLFNKTLSLLLSTLVDVFGANSQSSTVVEASEITDLIDFIHHVIHYEGQGGPVQASSKPRPDVLALIGSALENLRPDIRHLMLHLKPDVNSSIYATASASHPKC